jgi:PST family polysaccharide transporter
MLKFGLPLAGASLLLLALVNVDFVVVGRVLGTAELGFYLLAFNLSTWPMTLVTAAVRRVTTAMFARMNERGDGRQGFREALYLVLALGALLSALLAAYADGIVSFLYGERWAAAAQAVPALVVLSLGRMLVELSYDYLVAVGRTIGNAWLHGVWLVVLVPALVVGATNFGIQGVAWAHAIVVMALVVPGIGILLHRAGTRIRFLAADLLLPLVGAAGVLLSAWLVRSLLPSGFLMLAVGGLAGFAIYALITGPKFIRTVRNLLGSRPIAP